jgi:hypothetical protein
MQNTLEIIVTFLRCQYLSRGVAKEKNYQKSIGSKGSIFELCLWPLWEAHCLTTYLDPDDNFSQREYQKS